MRKLPALFLGAVLASQATAQSYDFSTFAGAPGEPGSADGTGRNAHFRQAAGIAITPAGIVYVADSGNATIRRITPDGVVTTLAGAAGVTGEVDGSGSTARFGFPADLKIDGSGNLFLVDRDNFSIRMVAPAGTVTTVFRFSRAPDSLGFRDRVFYKKPRDLAVDASGNCFVTLDYDTAIYRVTNGVSAVFTGSSDFPKISIDGNLADARFSELLGALTSDRSGNLFVADYFSIRKIAPAGVVSTLAGVSAQSGTTDGTGAGARLTSGSFIGTDTSGSIYYLDANSTVRKVTAEGVVTTVAGKVGDKRVVDGVGGTARFGAAYRGAVGPDGSLFVLDDSGSVIRRGTPTAAASIPIIHTQPAAPGGQFGKVGAGTKVTFSVGVSGTPPFSFQWTKGGQPIAGATNATFALFPVTATDEGAYAVKVTNSVGTVSSDSASIQVYTPSVPSFTARRAVPGGSFLWGVATNYTNLLVVVGTGGTILTSPNGRTWTTRNSGTTDWLVGVTYGGDPGRFVAVGDRGTILVSSDGVTWTRAAKSATTERLNNVAYGEKTFTAVGEKGTIVTSTDALTWTARPSDTTGWLRGLTYVAYPYSSSYMPGAFFACGQNGVVLQLTSGADWRGNAHWVRYSSDVEAFSGGGGVGVGVGQDGLVAYFYPIIITPQYSIGAAAPGAQPTFGGLIWNTSNIGINARFRGLTNSAGAIFVTGENGIIAASASATGPWAIVPSGTTANLVSGVSYANSVFVVGENETILQSEQLYNSRLINIATRGRVGTGANTLISGFVVDGSAPKQILVRAVGPALGAFGVSGALTSPVLTLFDSAGHEIASNTRWGTAANSATVAAVAARVGAFPFAAGSDDAAVLVTVPPGNYTAQVTGLNGVTGLGLVEIYDAESLSNEGSRAINISTRGNVGVADAQLIAGFVINGAAARRVLIRAAGPSLAQFGLNGLLAEPQIRLVNDRGAVVATAGAWNQQWNEREIRTAAILAGAFALDEDSKDAALVTELLPGAWTVQISGVNNTTGLAIVEVYDLP